MLYLVTGATGWLGRRVVRALTQGCAEMGEVGKGSQRVRALVQPGEDSTELTTLGAEIITGDVRDPQGIQRFVGDAADALLLHLAGIIHPRRRTRDFYAINVEGTRNVVTAAGKAGVRRVLAMSSNSPIGASRNPTELFDESSPYNPYMGYGRSKRTMEEWLRARDPKGRPEITIIRAPWFYGPGQPERQNAFFTMIKKGVFPVMGRGEARRSMAYVDSLAYGILLAATTPRAAGATYWLADERPYSTFEIVDTIRTVLRDDFGIPVSGRTLFIPGLVADAARLADRAIQCIGRYNQELHVLSELNLTIACVIDKAKRELAYQPLVNLREGMRRSVDWCLAHNVVI